MNERQRKITDPDEREPGGTMRAIVAIAFLMLNCTVVRAQSDPSSAMGMLEGCRDYLDNPKGDMPTTFQKGFAKGLCMGLVGSQLKASYLCPPEGVTTEQAVRVVVDYIDGNPAVGAENFVIVAAQGLRKAWPCRR